MVMIKISFINGNDQDQDMFINKQFSVWKRGGFCDRAAKCTPLSSFLPAPASRMVFELASFITFTCISTKPNSDHQFVHYLFSHIVRLAHWVGVGQPDRSSLSRGDIMAGAAFCATTILHCIFNWDSKCPPLPPLLLLYSGGVTNLAAQRHCARLRIDV